MSLRFLCIEIRENLLCANVFLQFDHSLTETEFLKINVEEGCLRFREYSTETAASVEDFFKIKASTISNLTVEECNASFRLTIESLKANQNARTTQETTTKASVVSQPLIEAASTVAALICKSCERQLTPAQSFQRIREFPSGSIDISEFFCHNAPDLEQQLVPRNSDLFYGFQFVVVNRALLMETTKEKNQHLYCQRCLQYLGETMFAGNAAKLWTDTLHLRCDNGDDTILTGVFEESTRKATHDLLRKILAESAAAVEPLELQMQLTKVVLEATFPDRQRKYMLMQILEKELPILRNHTPLAHGGHNNNNNALQVPLEYVKCYKLIFRIVEEEENTPALLAYWQQDISVQAVKMSPTLFSALYEELEENSSLLPELYRFTHDDFQLSYLFYKP